MLNFVFSCPSFLWSVVFCLVSIFNSIRGFGVHQYIAVLRTDGFGAQTYGRITCMLQTLASANQTYVHKPFSRVSHDVDELAAEDFLNLGENELWAEDITPTRDVRVINKQDCRLFANENTHLFEMLRPILRRKYFSPKATKKSEVIEFFHSDAVNVAVHIRRGDIVTKVGTPITKWADRFVSLEEVAESLSHLFTLLRKNNFTQNFNIQVFSEGEQEHFRDLEVHLPGLQIFYNLNLDILQTFHAFVLADVLVVGRSKFSYVPAILNDNLVVWGEDYSIYTKGASWIGYRRGEDLFYDRPEQKHKLKTLLLKIRQRASDT